MVDDGMRDKILLQIETSEERLRGIEDRMQELHELLRGLEIEHASVTSRIETLRETLDYLPESELKTRKRAPVSGRPLSDEWRHVLWLMKTEDGQNGSTYDDIVAYAERSGVTVRKETLRGQMANYRQAGYVISPTPGVFLVTNEGAAQAKAPLPPLNLAELDNDDDPFRTIAKTMTAPARPSGQGGESLGDIVARHMSVHVKKDPLDDDIPF